MTVGSESFLSYVGHPKGVLVAMHAIVVVC
jgi:hypothetical protein